ncbi:MAG: phosphatidate cytidylyltransferase [Oscillospiraceae bacterium]|nr:phosphatidate cytidylyltransferase [Oscillospiraceae bacterium]
MAAFWTGLGLVCVYFVICASIGVVIRLCTAIPDEPFRKLLHLILLGSLPVWISVYKLWWMAALSALLFAAVVYPILAAAEHLRGYSHLLTERKDGELKKSLLIVFSMFAVVITVCWGLLDDRWLAVASVFAWGFGDAAAALVGKRFGRHKLRGRHIEGTKSVEGSVAMFAVSFLSVFVVMTVRGGMGVFGCVAAAYVTAAVAAVVELYSMSGNDTITCPLAAMAVLLPLTWLFGGGV